MIVAVQIGELPERRRRREQLGVRRRNIAPLRIDCDDLASIGIGYHYAPAGPGTGFGQHRGDAFLQTRRGLGTQRSGKEKERQDQGALHCSSLILHQPRFTVSRRCEVTG